MQQGNMVGRLTPATGEIKLVTMPIANSEPYGLVINSKGVPFFAQLMGNRIGSIDPVTMQVREYFLGEGTGPRRLAVMPDDIIYYTDYARGTLGRLDPAAGRTKEWTSPSGARSQPYAITGFRQDRLVRGRQRQPEHARAIRSGDGEIPDVADSSLGRRRGPPHGGWA
jgi:virginiamycin B lyase